MSRIRGPSRLWLDDEEMAKKDDDHDLGKLPRPGGAAHWQTARVPRRRFILRIAIYSLLAFLVIAGIVRLLNSLIESSSSSPYHVDNQDAYREPKFEPPASDRTPKTGPADTDQRVVEEKPRTYNGKLRFPELAKSLQAISGATAGSSAQNRNILFAASNLHSAATILPLACQMAMEKENYVHFALVSRSNIEMKDLFDINGIDETCLVIPHDARPDEADVSTEARMTVAATRALYHLNRYLHPQALLVDSTSSEEDWFLSGMREEVKATAMSLIELPANPGKSMKWLTKLDASALGAWSKVHFDIMIHAPPRGTGNLERLLKSLYLADLSAVSVPHLTIELPPAIDKSLQNLMSGFQWPPSRLKGAAQSTSMLSLRHRIAWQRATPEETSVRFLESFWPAKPSHNHILVLSPHTEVTPQFFHYVKYALLRYRYSSTALAHDLGTRMMGISFTSPHFSLDGKQPFRPPPPLDSPDPTSGGTPYMWQAPSSDAVLFFGSRWMELHHLAVKSLERQYAMGESPALLSQKQVSKRQPAWLEYVLQLSRIRGYFTLYPDRATADAIIGVHNDLRELPEEFQGRSSTDDDDGDQTISWLPDSVSETFDSGSQVDMLATLPQGGTLIPLNEQPLITWDDEKVKLETFLRRALEYVQEFRRDVGQCDEDHASSQSPQSDAGDLFCEITSDVRRDV